MRVVNPRLILQIDQRSDHLPAFVAHLISDSCAGFQSLSEIIMRISRQRDRLENIGMIDDGIDPIRLENTLYRARRAMSAP